MNNKQRLLFLSCLAFIILAINAFAAEGGSYVTKGNLSITVDSILCFVGFLILGGVEIFGVHYANKEASKDRTFTILSKYFHKDLSPHVESAWEFIHDSDRTQSEKLNDFHNNPQVRANLIEVFNFFEEIGLMYNADLLDKQIIKRYFGPIILGYFIHSKWLIQSLRETHPFGETYEEWENMITSLPMKIGRENRLSIKMFQLTLQWEKTQGNLRSIR